MEKEIKDLTDMEAVALLSNTEAVESMSDDNYRELINRVTVYHKLEGNKIYSELVLDNDFSITDLTEDGK